ncbi:MAG: NADP-dependent phosphogluconate dehydrogenase [Planctomycetes bacterium]|nr:NADP-dependent phosphogluconate dehydrogenase [Planctomycetota bacterium]
MTDARAALGIAGLGVMGRNLALNFEEHGLSVAVWNRTAERTDQFLLQHPGRRFVRTETLDALVAALERPRKILLMVSSGDAIDDLIAGLRPLLEPGDILIDGGNSHYEMTRRRAAELAEQGLCFYGLGISGGEEGARKGPSLMAGGDAERFGLIRTELEAIAAKTAHGPCVALLGPDGAGHFVKMAHNGIEYADLQLVAEAYDLLRRRVGMEVEELARLFGAWNRGPLESFVLEITAKILNVRDPDTGRPLIDLVLDRAEQKGTGRWAVEAAFELGVPAPTVAAAVDARMLSSLKEERVAASRCLRGPAPDPSAAEYLPPAVHDALIAARLCVYAQGFALIRAASREFQWNVDLAEVARIWSGGSIVRSGLLEVLRQSILPKQDVANALIDDPLGGLVQEHQGALRKVVAAAAQAGIPVPAFASALAYFDAYRTAELPQNLTQAQRDAFGAHTYVRKDQPGRGPTHTDWLR